MRVSTGQLTTAQVRFIEDGENEVEFYINGYYVCNINLDKCSGEVLTEISQYV